MIRDNGPKRRQRTGNANFTEAEVRHIKKILREGANPRDIAEAHCCGLETIRRIGRGDTWAWVEIEERAEAVAEAIMHIPNVKVDAESDAILERLIARGLVRGAEPSALEKLQADIAKHDAPNKELEELMKKPESLG